jgi:hypothetical protein
MWPGDHHLRHSTTRIEEQQQQQQQQQQQHQSSRGGLTTNRIAFESNESNTGIHPDVSGADRRIGQQLSPPENLLVARPLILLRTNELGLPIPAPAVATSTSSKTSAEPRRRRRSSKTKQVVDTTTSTSSTSPQNDSAADRLDSILKQHPPVQSTQGSTEEEPHEFVAAATSAATPVSSHPQHEREGVTIPTQSNVVDPKDEDEIDDLPILARLISQSRQPFLLLSDNHASHAAFPSQSSSVETSPSEHARRDSTPMAPRRSNSSDLVATIAEAAAAIRAEEEGTDQEAVVVESSETTTHPVPTQTRVSSPPRYDQRSSTVVPVQKRVATASAALVASDPIQKTSSSSASSKEPPSSSESSIGLLSLGGSSGRDAKSLGESSTWKPNYLSNSSSSSSSSLEEPSTPSNDVPSSSNSDSPDSTDVLPGSGGVAVSAGSAEKRTGRIYLSPHNSGLSLNGRRSPGSSTRSFTMTGRSPGSSTRSLIYESSPASSARSSVMGQQFLPEDFVEELSLAYSSHGSSVDGPGWDEGNASSSSRHSRRSSRDVVGRGAGVASSSHVSSSHHSRSSHTSTVSRGLDDLLVTSHRKSSSSTTVYDGVLVALVEAMHGSGSSMDFNSSMNSFSSNRSDLSPRRKNKRLASSGSISTMISQGLHPSSSSQSLYVSSSSSVSHRSGSRTADDKDKKKDGAKQKRSHSAPHKVQQTSHQLPPSGHHGSSGTCDLSEDAKGKKKGKKTQFTDGQMARQHSVGAFSTESPHQVTLSSMLASGGASGSSLEVGSSVFTPQTASSLSMESAKRVIQKLDGIRASTHHNLDVPRSASPVPRSKLSVKVLPKQERRKSLPSRLEQGRIRSPRRRQFHMYKAHKEEQEKGAISEEAGPGVSSVTPKERISISKLADHYLAMEASMEEEELPVSPPTSRREDLSPSSKPPRPVDPVDPRARTVRTSNRSFDTLPPRSSPRIPRSPGGKNVSTAPASPVRPSSPWGKARSSIGHIIPPISMSSSSSTSSHSRRRDDGCSVSSGSSHGIARGRDSHCQESLTFSAANLQSSVHSESVPSSRRDREHSMGSSKSTQYFSASSSTQESTDSIRRARSVSPSPFHISATIPPAFQATPAHEKTTSVAKQVPFKSAPPNRTKSSSSSSTLDLSPYPMDIPATSAAKERAKDRRLKRRHQRQHHREQLPVTLENPSSSISLSESSVNSKDPMARHERSVLQERRDYRSVPALACSSSSSSSSHSSLSSNEQLPVEATTPSSRRRYQSRGEHPRLPSPPVPRSVDSGVSPGHGSFSYESPGSIWEKIQEEKIRQGKLRARLLLSSGRTPPTAPVTSSPQTPAKLAAAVHQLAKIPEL